MHNVLAPTTGLSLDGSMLNPAAVTGRHSYAPQNCTDDQFIAMLNGKIMPRKRDVVTVRFGTPIKFSNRDSITEVTNRLQAVMKDL